MKHKLESGLLGEISITSDMQITPPLWQKARKNSRASWWKWKSEKVKLDIQKTKIRASSPITAWQIDGETVADFIFWGSKITAWWFHGDYSHEIKTHLLLGRKVMTNLDSIFGEGNGNPLQYSCLANPRDGGASWAAVYGVAQSWTWLKCLSSSSRQHIKKQRHYFANKGPSSQGCGFYSSHVWMWELDHKEVWVYWGHEEDFWEPLGLQGDQISQS